MKSKFKTINEIVDEIIITEQLKKRQRFNCLIAIAILFLLLIIGLFQ